MNVKIELIKRRYSTFLFVLLLIFAFTNIPIIFNPLTQIADADNITDYLYNSSYLSVTTPIPEEPPPPPPPSPIPPPILPPVDLTKPIIRWYDFQTKHGNSMLNSKIDVN